MLATQADLDDLCWDLAMTAVTLFELDYRTDDWRKTHMLAREAARRRGNHRGAAAILYSLGILAAREDIGQAAGFLESALEKFAKLDDGHGCALAQAGIAFVDRLGGRDESAMKHYLLLAMDRFHEVGDPRLSANASATM